MEKTIEEITLIIRNEEFIPKDADIHKLDKLLESVEDLMLKAKRALKQSKNYE